MLRHATRSQLSDLFQNIIRPALQRVSDLTNAPPEGDRNQSANSNGNSMNNSVYSSMDLIPNINSSNVNNTNSNASITNPNLKLNLNMNLNTNNSNNNNNIENKNENKAGNLSSRTAIAKLSNSVSHFRRHSTNNVSGNSKSFLPTHNTSRRNVFSSTIMNSVTSSLSNTNTENNTQQNTNNNTRNNSTNTSAHNSHNDSIFNSACDSACPSVLQTQKNSIDALEGGNFKDNFENKTLSDSDALETDLNRVFDQSIINDFFTAIPCEETEITKDDFLSRASAVLNAGNLMPKYYYMIYLMF